MIRINMNSSAAGAKSYFDRADYYSEGQELEGVWGGKGAARLGLSGTVGKSAWEALCENRDPHTGRTLTARQKSERRIGYDINFHVPKSVSVLYGLSGDCRILDAFDHAVSKTMDEFESEMKTRVRQGGKNEDRVTGEMLYAKYVHFTSRPTNCVPDPHLHAHVFCFNTTFDPVENRWKAGQFAGLKQSAPYYQARFHSRLADRLTQLGLPIERTKKGYEIGGIAQATLDKFSRRTELIEALAKEKKITSASEKAELGARTREKKTKKLTMPQLRQTWVARMDGNEQAGLLAVADRVGDTPVSKEAGAAQRAAREAILHCFERNSVVPEKTLLAEAIRRGTGHATADAVEAAVREQDLIVGEKDGKRYATTHAVLREEQRMLDYARLGRGSCRPLGDGPHTFSRDWLNQDQRRAVEHVLRSTDAVILVRGVAGTGKTTLMQEAIEGVEAGGHRVFTFAPSAEASRGVLRGAGFHSAETVARLLIDQELQAQIRQQVIWIDEASLLSSRQMGEVFDLAERLEARLVLSGDHRQTGSVERGAALRLLETESGLLPVEVKEIQRQKGAYKQAIQSLSRGHTEKGFDELDQLGWISEVEDSNRYEQIACDYVEAIKTGKTALVVAPTHAEGHRVTDAVRDELRREKMIGKEERRFRVLHNANLTQAERADPVHLSSGDVLLFHQNVAGYTKGQRLVVGEAPLPLDKADRYTVYRQGSVSLSAGDLIRVSRNGVTTDGLHRLNNGAIYKVKGFSNRGDIQLDNGWTVDKEFGFIQPGYAVTAQASQGKTVDRVLISASSLSFPAASREGFYVAASRGRESCRVYTDDKRALLDAVSQSDDRLSATEFVNVNPSRQRGEAMQRMDRKREATRRHERERQPVEVMNYER